MPIKAPKKEGGDFEIAPAGNHIARVYRIINLGNVPYTYQGQEKRGPKIRVYFELCNEIVEYEKDGQKVTRPFSVSEEYTLSMHSKAILRKIVEGIVGNMKDEEAWEFDIETILGKACLLNVVHNKSKDGQKEYANVAGTSPIPKGMGDAPAIVNAPAIVDVLTASLEQIDALPDFLKEKMRGSTEFYERFLAVEQDSADDAFAGGEQA
jgi:hypothetical protein